MESTQASLLFVHAHPDDETLSTGATMAAYAAEGAHVCLVTCTLGEEGEVLVPELAHLAATDEDRLGPHREGELRAAMAELGITDWRLLGGAGRFRDSGMVGLPSNQRPDCFWQADLLEAASLLVAIIREVRPQVLVTYDDFGGYGHPDHIQAHRVAMYAAVLAAAPSFRPDLGEAWDIPKIYWTALPREVVRAAVAAMPAAAREGSFFADDVDSVPFLVDDELVTTAIDGTAFVDRKIAAMRAHATQIDMEGSMFAHLAAGADPMLGVEFFRLVRSPAGYSPAMPEVDLLAGV